MRSDRVFALQGGGVVKGTIPCSGFPWCAYACLLLLHTNYPVPVLWHELQALTVGCCTSLVYVDDVSLVDVDDVGCSDGGGAQRAWGRNCAAYNSLKAYVWVVAVMLS